jgi:hypothetical protein
MKKDWAYYHDEHIGFFLTKKPDYGELAYSSIIRDLGSRRIKYGSPIYCYKCGEGIALSSSLVREADVNVTMYPMTKVQPGPGKVRFGCFKFMSGWRVEGLVVRSQNGLYALHKDIHDPHGHNQAELIAAIDMIMYYLKRDVDPNLTIGL